MSSSPNRSSPDIIPSISWNFLGYGWLGIINFFALPFIVRHLGDSLYGIYALIGLILGYTSFLNLGVGTASIKYISQYAANKDIGKIAGTFWACIAVSVLMGGVGSLAIALGAPILVNRFLDISADVKTLAVSVLRIGSIGFLIYMLRRSIGGVIQAIGRFDLFNWIKMGMGSLGIGAIVLLLAHGFSLRGMVISDLIVTGLCVLVFWVFAEHHLPMIKTPKWDRSALDQVFKFGIYATVADFVAPILIDVEKLMLVTLYPISELTYYSVPFRVMDALSVIPGAVGTVMFPAFSYFQGSNNIEINKELHFRSTLYLSLAYAFFVLFFTAFGGAFLSLWMGGIFAVKSASILMILIAAGWINAISYPSMNVLTGMGKPQLPAMFHLIEAVVYVPLAYVLIRRFDGQGAALAWFLRVCFDTLLLQVAACRLLECSVGRWCCRLLAKGALPPACGGFCFWLLHRQGWPLLASRNVCGILLITAMYCYLVWRMGLDDEARTRIREFLGAA